MPTAFASWIHGTTGQVENPERLAAIWRAGFYLEVKGNPATSTWLHYAIPTPVIVDDHRLHIHSVMVRYAIPDLGGHVSAVHIFDGERRIAALTHTSGRGDWTWPRFEVPSHPEVSWGIGVSINVQWGHPDAGAPEHARIQIASVGCDFITETRS
jgi:hypothetical protein